MAAGSRAEISSDVEVPAMISEYRPASRTRRAINWAYWAPKSRTTTGRPSRLFTLVRLRAAGDPHQERLPRVDRYSSAEKASKRLAIPAGSTESESRRSLTASDEA